MTAPAITISQLSFKYKEQASLFKDLNLTVETGERFGLFGPNGAGKTTLMSLLTGLHPFMEGNIELFGNSIHTKSKKIKSLFGFVPQDFSFYNELSPAENLEFFGAWYGLSKPEIQQRSEKLFKILDLTAVKNKAVKKFFADASCVFIAYKQRKPVFMRNVESAVLNCSNYHHQYNRHCKH